MASTKEEMESRKELTAYFLWQMWKNRNNWHFQSVKHEPMEIVQHARAEWLEFKECEFIAKPQQTNRTGSIQQGKWRAPEKDVVKLNVSSLRAGRDKGVGLGIVARNCFGELLQTWAIFLDFTDNPVIAELEAARVALIVAQQNSWRRVEIQGEIRAIADCLNARKCPAVEAAIIVDDVFLLASMFEGCRFSSAQSKRLMQSWKSPIPLWMLVEAAEDIRSFDLV